MSYLNLIEPSKLYAQVEFRHHLSNDLLLNGRIPIVINSRSSFQTDRVFISNVHVIHGYLFRKGMVKC